MGYGNALACSTRFETLGLSGAIGTLVTSGSGAYGTLTTIGTTSFDYDGFIVDFQPYTSTSVTQARVTITAGNGGGDEAIVADYFIDGSYVYSARSVDFAVAVPKGAVLKAKLYGPNTSVAEWMTICGYQGDGRRPRGFSRVVSLTDWTGQDPTGSITMTGTTQTGWAQIQASSPNRAGGLYWMLDGRGKGNSGLTSLRASFDIGWGASGSERVFYQIATWTNIANGHGGPIPCDFPAGTRFAFRGIASGTDTDVLSIVLCGLAA